ncbi:benenodin family lasso peptide [Sphingomonas crusticola]|nr:benenodin family lasso peptide [Sphingomonas crusticola]
MERINEELIDLGAASVETKGPGGKPGDVQLGRFELGLVED